MQIFYVFSQNTAHEDLAEAVFLKQINSLQQGLKLFF